MKHTSQAKRSNLLGLFTRTPHIEKHVKIKTKREKVKNLAFAVTLLFLCTLTYGFINVVESHATQSEVVK